MTALGLTGGSRGLAKCPLEGQTRGTDSIECRIGERLVFEAINTAFEANNRPKVMYGAGAASLGAGGGLGASGMMGGGAAPGSMLPMMGAGAMGAYGVPQQGAYGAPPLQQPGGPYGAPQQQMAPGGMMMGPGGMMMAPSGGQDHLVREQDRFLPIANISRIMRRVLPPNAKVAKEAKEAIQESVSELISFITSEASDKCMQERRKTINGDDVLWAMATLGFEPYVEPLRLHLAKFRETTRIQSGEAKAVIRGEKELKAAAAAAAAAAGDGDGSAGGGDGEAWAGGGGADAGAGEGEGAEGDET